MPLAEEFLVYSIALDYYISPRRNLPAMVDCVQSPLETDSACATLSRVRYRQKIFPDDVGIIRVSYSFHSPFVPGKLLSFSNGKFQTFSFF